MISSKEGKLLLPDVGSKYSKTHQNILLGYEPFLLFWAL